MCLIIDGKKSNAIRNFNFHNFKTHTHTHTLIDKTFSFYKDSNDFFFPNLNDSNELNCEI